MISPADAVMIFTANFLIVFLLGIQSRNVVAGRYLAAIVTSFGISVGNFIFVKVAATGGALAFSLCAIGGCMGIAASIWFYQNVVEKKFPDGSSSFPKIKCVGCVGEHCDQKACGTDGEK